MRHNPDKHYKTEQFSITVENPNSQTGLPHIFYFPESQRQAVYNGLNDIAPCDCINGDTFSFELAPRKNWDGRSSNFEFDVDYFDEVLDYLVENCTMYDGPNTIE